MPANRVKGTRARGAEFPEVEVMPTRAERCATLVITLRWTLATTLVVTLLSYGMPTDYAAVAVGAAFFAFTYALVLRRDTVTIRTYQLSLGGLLEPEPLNLNRVLRRALCALGFALVPCVIFFPLFWWGFIWFWRPIGAFTAEPLRLLGRVLLDEGLGQLFVIAVPEEMFYRGYVQHALDQVWRPRFELAGAMIGPSLFVTSLIFALGHLATDSQLSRLGVFFPSLVFGWLKARTGGIGASVAFHAFCNLFASYLARGYVFSP